MRSLGDLWPLADLAKIVRSCRTVGIVMEARSCALWTWQIRWLQVLSPASHELLPLFSFPIFELRRDLVGRGVFAVADEFLRSVAARATTEGEDGAL